jgi:hypothetical protein
MTVPFQLLKPQPRRGHLQRALSDPEIHIETAAALNSLPATSAAVNVELKAKAAEVVDSSESKERTKDDTKKAKRGPIKACNCNTGAIKLNEATMARLAVLLRSGCSVLHACEDVRSSAVNAPFCFMVILTLNTAPLCRLACPGHRSIVGWIALARMTPRTYTMSERLLA